MEKLIVFAKKQYLEHKSFIIYGFISVLVTVIDVITCRICELFFRPVFSNTLGVLVGFIIQYILTSRHVYNSKNLRTFIVFLLTFFIGLILANTIVFASRTYLFNNSESEISFLVSKGFSIVLPFFVTYYLRKIFITNNN